MSLFGVEDIRNVVLISHQGAGKTTLAESMLFRAGVINRMGTIDDGNTVMDFDQEEKTKKTSINLSMANFTWKEKKINILDTPGYIDFIFETIAAAKVAESAIVLVDSASGVEVGTEINWDKLDEKNMPRLVFINHMTKDNADFEKCLSSLRESFPKVIFTPFVLPLGKGTSFKGVVDTVAKKARIIEGGKVIDADVPAELTAKVDEAYNTIAESATEADEGLMEKYLEGQKLTEQEISKGLVEAFKKNLFVPVLCGDAVLGAGVEDLLNLIVSLSPSPSVAYPMKAKKVFGDGETEINMESPFSGLVFKMTAEQHVGEICYLRAYSGKVSTGSELLNSRTGKMEKIGQMFSVSGKERVETKELSAGDIAALVKLKDTTTNDTLSDKNLSVEIEKIRFPEPSITFAVIPESKSDDEKMISGLTKIQKEDPSFRFRYDSETRQTLVEGMGETHLEIILSKIKKSGSNLKFEKPIIKYRETIRKKAEAQGRHKKQSGGRGQFADVWIRFEPTERGKDFEFKDEIFGGAVPKNYIPAVQKGLEEVRKKGILSNSLTVDFRAILFDGSYHKVDSSDLAFQIAASLAFQKAIPEANPILLEPIVSIEVTIPNENTGDIMGDISTRRGKVLGMEPLGKWQKIKALVPEAEMYMYSTNLRSITQGRGFFTQKLSHYEEVPKELTMKIAEETRKRREENHE
ncbi:elongation factor G [candidate division WOR-3 bacterium]|nr:elongation factor G [candidate division WOR-3 bacterium]